LLGRVFVEIIVHLKMILKQNRLNISIGLSKENTFAEKEN
jgi:hypothetical protein